MKTAAEWLSIEVNCTVADLVMAICKDRDIIVSNLILLAKLAYKEGVRDGTARGQGDADVTEEVQMADFSASAVLKRIPEAIGQ